VLFNEPKLLKYNEQRNTLKARRGFSALQRAEIAEMLVNAPLILADGAFQCSSTSRNC